VRQGIFVGLEVLRRKDKIMSKNQRACIVCGARVRNINPKCNTCSPFCTEIKRTGKTRDELVREDSQIPKDEDLLDLNNKVKTTFPLNSFPE
jgi:hypothetical protein